MFKNVDILTSVFSHIVGLCVNGVLLISLFCYIIWQVNM